MKPSKMEVKIISKELIKPSSPTPSHLQKMTLSFLDQNSSPNTIPALLFYRAPPDTAAPFNITRLKTALSETLTCFYPLAGRYKTLGTISCNDEGVPFIEARVNCPISSVISSPSSSNVDFLSFYPPGRENLKKSGIHLSIQVNVCTCGGFVIGWYHTHKVTDGISTATFFRYWAALVTQRYEDAGQAKPDFSSSVTYFPPLPGKDKPVTPELELHEPKGMEKSSNVVRSFVFKNGAITKLKAKSVSDQVPNPSRFEAVSGFLWKQILLAASTKEGRSIMGVLLDLRSRTDPPMPKGSMGNLVETAFVKAETRAELPELVSEIRETMTEMKKVVAGYQSDKREAAKEKHWRGFIKAYMECKRNNVYLLTSWCKASGFSDVDFGFGKPVWIVPVDSKINPINYLKDMIILTEFGDLDGGGIEAWLFLEEEHIKFLEFNHEFLDFASPNF
ncbi:hypothetical protein RND81_04G031900 [Saponaria officinalis]|uniref:Transferase n=1 Tax=Saponaria officinalis TaxID=3572 RepID=A0AAW1LIF2_SAPOF